jgi:hypothetical protein
LQLKTILNRIQGFVGFVYQNVRLCTGSGDAAQIETLSCRMAACVDGARCANDLRLGVEGSLPALLEIQVPDPG